jgi:hypothetical protein
LAPVFFGINKVFSTEVSHSIHEAQKENTKGTRDFFREWYTLEKG